MEFEFEKVKESVREERETEFERDKQSETVGEKERERETVREKERPSTHHSYM